MLRLLVTALGATFGWWIGILAGITIGAPIGFFVGPVAGRVVGGIVAGLIGGAIEARSNPAMRGKRLRFTGATALATAIASVLLLDGQVLPWLVGGAFGAAIGGAQAAAVSLPRREALLRAATSAAGWSLGFIVLHDGGASYSKLGVLGPGLAAIILALASVPRAARSFSRAAAIG